MACRELGISVPAQVSVVGFDDVELAQYVTPPLTTIHQPKLRLGQLAMEMLLSLMEKQPVVDQLVPVDLVVRCSTAPAPLVMFRAGPDTVLAGRLVLLTRVCLKLGAGTLREGWIIAKGYHACVNTPLRTW